MGEPRKIRKKYQTPRHPWEKTRIDEEKKLTQEYGFKNKKEIWKVTSKLKQFKDRTKKLSALTGDQAELETNQLLVKLRSINVLQHEQELNEVLGLEPGVLADRRLQTIVYNKKLARSVKQARQMIVHKHILVNNNTITSPAYIVDIAEEGQISFSPNSPFFATDHPERLGSEGIALKPEEKEELALKKEIDAKHEAKPKAKKTEVKKEKPKAEPKSEAKEESKTEDAKEAPKEPEAQTPEVEVKSAEAETPEELTKGAKNEPATPAQAKETKVENPEAKE